MQQRFLLCLILTLFLSGCNSHLPVVIQHAPETDLAITEVKANTEVHQGQFVRWGGTIISVENKNDSTWIEVLGRPLNSFGRPITNYDEYDGRFLVRVDGFLEPEQYKKDRKLTVYGVVETKLARNLDEHIYEYPLIHAKEHYLWREYRRIHYPYYARYYHYPYYRYHHFYPSHFRFHHRLHFGLHHW